MTVQIVGYEKLSFKGDDGNQINGTKLHIVYNDERVTGTAVNTVFVKDNIDVSFVEVGKMYKLKYEFNFKGRAKLIGIEEVKQ